MTETRYSDVTGDMRPDWSTRGGPGLDFPCKRREVVECAFSECQQRRRCRYEIDGTFPMSTFAERKAERKRHYEQFEKSWKLVTCTACSGSGYYDNDGSPACGCCGGTGKMRKRSTNDVNQ